MEICKLSVLMLTVLALACSVQGLSLTLNRDPWISDNWEDEPVEETLVSQVASLLKRSKSHQFYGLMGRRSGKICCFLEGHKGHMFVGLMGKRSSGGMTLLCVGNSFIQRKKPLTLAFPYSFPILSTCMFFVYYIDLKKHLAMCTVLAN
uniref:Si:ch211-131k2.2 n=1 Tax=Cyprinus carpio TaxID=7962 RepID=A0A8C2A319_CYPCA